jgi:hypothetical protein
MTSRIYNCNTPENHGDVYAECYQPHPSNGKIDGCSTAYDFGSTSKDCSCGSDGKTHTCSHDFDSKEHEGSCNFKTNGNIQCCNDTIDLSTLENLGFNISTKEDTEKLIDEIEGFRGNLKDLIFLLKSKFC